MVETTSENLARELARTYSGGRYEDGWGCVQEYRSYEKHLDEHPDDGSRAVASALDIPRGRVRSWNRGQRPDAVRAVDVSEEMGWLEVQSDSVRWQSVNVLIAWIFGRGSISGRDYTPMFSVTPRTKSCLREALAGAGLTEWRLEHEQSTEKGTQLHLEEYANVFGRLLTVLGAPLGEKSAESVGLPEYLQSASRGSRLDFARTVVWTRGTVDTGETQSVIVRMSEFDSGFRNQFLQLVSELDAGEVSLQEEDLHLGPAAAESLDSSPSICGESG